MPSIDRSTKLKILIALPDIRQATTLQHDLEYLGHSIQLCQNLDMSLRLLRNWQPDLVVTDEVLERGLPDSGLRLAEYCQATADQVNGWPGTRSLVLVPVPDWDRVRRAQTAGAHVIVKGPDFEAAIRYVQTIADHLATDLTLGPVLVGLHRFLGKAPHPRCNDCEWIGVSISYGNSQTNLDLTPVRAALLNILLFRRRSQAADTIEEVCRNSAFIARILRGRSLRESAVKMEISRLRQDIGKALQFLGAPYNGHHYLPFTQYGMQTYGLAGNRRLTHIPTGSY